MLIQKTIQPDNTRKTPIVRTTKDLRALLNNLKTIGTD